MPNASLSCTGRDGSTVPRFATKLVYDDNHKSSNPSRLARIATVVTMSLLCAGCASGPKRTLDMSARYNLATTHTSTCNFRQAGLLDLRRQRGWSRARPVYVPRRAASAIWKAARITGISPRYLAATAKRESNFKAAAAARTSTARGMFQFIEQTWLEAFARDGACLGMPRLARHIIRARDGRYIVRSYRARRHILALRNNPQLASILAARLAQRNARTLTRYLRRRPTPGELYVAHFLGAKDAARMATLARRYPYHPAYREFRQAARANKAIFFKRGRPRSYGEVWYSLTHRHDRLEFVFT